MATKRLLALLLILVLIPIGVVSATTGIRNSGKSL